MNTEEESKTGTENEVTQEQNMIASIQRIESELVRINSHKLVKVYNSIPQLIGFQFVKGMAFGLGSVIGATIIVSILAFLLSQIEFVPIIGEWVKHIVAEIEK